ncbi:hypothetical protein PISMIDRAFT_671133 [Pisolithus microcarpus 441]|uniref:Uncharacterized protein n=1 Tax=Pisolithus microcarpus 441 TaxID=765257 RepID=A0A0C9YYA5_9AGAM|nr:hypothetical protein PISMIDRAFT_671133 [Pisolithus microcarpus 441]
MKAGVSARTRHVTTAKWSSPASAYWRYAEREEIDKRQEKVKEKKQEVHAKASGRARHSRGGADSIFRASRSCVGVVSNHPTTGSVGSNSSSSG